MSDETIEVNGLRPMTREELELGARFVTALLHMGAVLRPDNPAEVVLSGIVGDCCEKKVPREELHTLIDRVYDTVESSITRVSSFMSGGPNLKVVADPPSSPFTSREAPTKP